MKVSVRKLEELLGRKLNLSSEEISKILLQLGFEVSAATSYSSCLGVTVSEILEISKHPHADRLQIARITDGKETASVVCGAPNIGVGQKVFWAKVGSVLASGQKVGESVIRGIPSPGMICSTRELGVGEDHTGIWILDRDLTIGTAAEEWIAFEDSILEVEVTPNRPDCLSEIGLAREIAASLGFAAPGLDFFPLPQAPASLSQYPVEIADGCGCLQYVAKKLDGVAVRLSPLGLQVRLTRCGIRPINNVVDITNSVLLETGQPLHAFDADKLVGKKLAVRRAAAGESIRALDGKNYALAPDILVIADGSKPVAIAGIMGGEETSVTEQTRNILLESAIFDRSLVRQSRKKLNLSSESSYRFERGVTPWSCVVASARAETMLAQIAGGRITSYTRAVAQAPSETPVSVRVSQAEKILGEKMSTSQIQAAMQKLGATVLFSDRDLLQMKSPPWRVDLCQEIDFIEEVARLEGYDKIPSAGTHARLAPLAEKKSLRPLKKRLRLFLKTLGFWEAYNYGFVSDSYCARFFDPRTLAEVENPLATGESFLRPALCLELLKNVRQNLAYQKRDVRLFEIGRIFRKSGAAFVERESLAGAACGGIWAESWQFQHSEPIDFFWIKGVLEKIREALGAQKLRIKKGSSNDLGGIEKMFHPAHVCSVLDPSGKKTLGIFGLAHPETSKERDIPENTVMFELDLAELQNALRADPKIKAVTRTPFVQRDCSVWVKEEIAWGDLREEIGRAGGSLLEKCELFDLFRGSGHPGEKSLSFTFTFRDAEKTLSDEIANEMRDKIVAHLQKKFKAELRKR